MKKKPRTCTFKIVILNAQRKYCRNLCTKNFTYTKKFYIHEIAAVNLSKIYFLKNAKKTCKPNNRDLNRGWIILFKARNPTKFWQKFSGDLFLRIQNGTNLAEKNFRRSAKNLTKSAKINSRKHLSRKN